MFIKNHVNTVLVFWKEYLYTYLNSLIEVRNGDYIIFSTLKVVNNNGIILFSGGEASAITNIP